MKWVLVETALDILFFQLARGTIGKTKYGIVFFCLEITFDAATYTCICCSRAEGQAGCLQQKRGFCCSRVAYRQPQFNRLQENLLHYVTAV